MNQFFLEGWQLIHRMASNASACDFDDESDAHLCVDLHAWSFFVFGIPEKLGFSCGNGELPYRQDQLGKFILDALTSKVEDELLRKRGIASEQSLLNVLIGSKSRSPWNFLISRLIDKMPVANRKKLDHRNPLSIIRAGITEISLAKTGHVYRIVLGLTLIGIGYRLWNMPARCAYCYRIAAAGQRLCSTHVVDHQITIKDGHEYNQVVRHKIGKRASAKMRNIQDVRWARYCNSVFQNNDSVLFNHIFRNETLLDWRDIDAQDKIAINNAKLQFDQLTRSIDQTIYVKRIFAENSVSYADICANQLVEHCRSLLDPLDHNQSLAHWGNKVEIADLWFSVEDKYTSPKMGKMTTPERLQEVNRYAESGHTKSEVAELLNIKPNTLSMWLKRYPDTLKKAITKWQTSQTIA